MNGNPTTARDQIPRGVGQDGQEDADEEEDGDEDADEDGDVGFGPSEVVRHKHKTAQK